MSLSWTEKKKTEKGYDQTATANGRTYRLQCRWGSRFDLYINELWQQGMRYTKHECLAKAEADAEQHDEGKREGEQRPDPTKTPAETFHPSSTIPTTPAVEHEHPGSEPDPLRDGPPEPPPPPPPEGLLRPWIDNGRSYVNLPKNELSGPGDDTPSALNATTLPRSEWIGKPPAPFEPVPGAVILGRTVQTDGRRLRIGRAGETFAVITVYQMLKKGEARRMRKALHRAGHPRLAAARC